MPGDKKVPGFDQASHLIHAVLQPAAGAILFASRSSVITEVSPVLAFFVGALVAGSVHGVRAVFRPVVTLTTAGHGNALVSILEDIAAVMLAIGVILAPVFVIAVTAAGLLLVVWLWRNWSVPLGTPIGGNKEDWPQGKP